MSPLPNHNSPLSNLSAAFKLLQQECDPSLQSALASLYAAITIDSDAVVINNATQLRQHIAVLARIGALGTENTSLAAHRASWAIADSCALYPASIDQLYRGIGQQQLSRRFTVPAINMRAITFESARGVFQAMMDSNTAAVIFELSRGEIGFTDQRPREYATSILCAAIAENYSGPIFLQGDHFQISASQYQQDPEAEKVAVADLIQEAICAGFFNIDIDASTLVDLSRQSIAEQQTLNIELTTALAGVARAAEPAGVTVSLGGEIGEVGEHNSTVEELQIYLKGVADGLTASSAGITKVSIQSGTRHGGNILADGSFGDMPIDFELIQSLSFTCRDQFAVGGCVQHGASMLSLEKMDKLPAAGCIEVHLAAGFLNDVYANLPAAEVRQVDQWLQEQFPDEWQENWTQAQFLHHARRYAIGPNKQKWWDNTECHNSVRQAVKARAAGYFRVLGVENTRELIASVITHAPVKWVAPDRGRSANHTSEKTIGDLAS